MSKITFNYKGNEIVIPCEEKEKFGPIVQSFVKKQEYKEKFSIFYLMGNFR
jgi:hypothetical protein